MPAFNYWWIDAEIAPLGWGEGIVQFGHHSYNPAKDCSACQPNTWHWDNIEIIPTVPFTMLPADRRYVAAGGPTSVSLATPSPAGSHLRFSGIGDRIEVSFDGGQSWQEAQMQAQEEYHADHFRSYWTPLPAGVTNILFRGDDWWGGGWHARDISVWSRPVSAAAHEGPAGITLAGSAGAPAARQELCLLPLPAGGQAVALADD
jgi:hypothetical protein